MPTPIPVALSLFRFMSYCEPSIIAEDVRHVQCPRHFIIISTFVPKYIGMRDSPGTTCLRRQGHRLSGRHVWTHIQISIFSFR